MKYTRTQHALAEVASQLWDKAFRELFFTLTTECLALDLCAGQLKALLALHESGPIPMSKVASLLNTTPATATRVIDRMVYRGLVIRRRDSTDRRLVLCGLSERGEELADGPWQSARQRAETLLRTHSRHKPVSVKATEEPQGESRILAKKEAQLESEHPGDRVFAPHRSAVRCGQLGRP
jgi:DNA-binding MarR family transcriptional regulator